MAIGTPQLGTVTEATAAGTTAVPYPATVNAGDVAVLFGSTQSTTLTTLPAGWTSVASFANTGNTLVPSIFAAIKVMAGTEGGTTLTVTHASTVSLWQINTYSGVDNTTPQDVAAQTVDQSVGSTTLVFSGVTIATAGAALVYCGADSATAQTATPPSGFTETADRSTGTRVATAGYQLGLSTGATGSVTVTWSGSGKSVGVLLALRPAVTGFNGTATVPLVDTITSAGTVGESTGSALSETATITSAGTVGAATGSTLSPVVTITSAGVVGTSTGSTIPLTVTFTAAGSLGGGSLSTGASVPLVDTITSAGAVGTNSTTAVALTAAVVSAGAVGKATGSTVPLVDTVTSAGAVGTSAATTLALTDTISSSGVVGESSGTAVPLTFTLTTAGLIGRLTGAALAQTITITAAGTVTGTSTAGQMSSALGPVPAMSSALAPGGMSASQGPTAGMSSTAGGSAGMSSAPGLTPSMAGS